jgi:prophage regulatory protein
MTTDINPSTDIAIPQGGTTQALLRLPQVLALIPVSRSHWWSGVASGKYPTGIKLSSRVTVWKSGHIHNLIASLK